MKVARWIIETLVTYYDLEKISNPKVVYLDGKKRSYRDQSIL
jgi:hypothetical protein